MMKKILTISLLVGFLSLNGCTMLAATFFQRASDAEDRANKYVVWILDTRQEDRKLKRDVVKSGVEQMKLQTLQLTSEGKLDEAQALRVKTLALIDDNTPSLKDAVANIKALWAGVKK